MNAPARAGLSVPVTEEQLELRHRVVDTGTPVRVRKEVDQVTAQAQESRLIDGVQVERRPVGRVIDAVPQVRTEGDVTVIPVVEERLVTRKELVLVEEVWLTRQRQVVHTPTQVPLRRERVQVERLDPESGEWLAKPDGPDAQSNPNPNPPPHRSS